MVGIDFKYHQVSFFFLNENLVCNKMPLKICHEEKKYVDYSNLISPSASAFLILFLVNSISLQIKISKA